MRRRNRILKSRFRITPIRPARLTGSRRTVAVRKQHFCDPGKAFLEFELDPETFFAVEDLAREAGCEPFEMCVRLLRERLELL